MDEATNRRASGFVALSLRRLATPAPKPDARPDASAFGSQSVVEVDIIHRDRVKPFAEDRLEAPEAPSVPSEQLIDAIAKRSEFRAKGLAVFLASLRIEDSQGWVLVRADVQKDQRSGRLLREFV